MRVCVAPSVEAAVVIAPMAVSTCVVNAPGKVALVGDRIGQGMNVEIGDTHIGGAVHRVEDAGLAIGVVELGLRGVDGDGADGDRTRGVAREGGDDAS